MSTINDIVNLISKYNSLLNEAKEKNYISTKNFIGDITETLVCEVIGATKCHNPSQKGYDAIRDKDKIQIKYRSKNKKGKYKITFKNVTKKSLGFNILVLCCQSEDSFYIYEINIEDLPNMKYVKKKNRIILMLTDDFLTKENIKKTEIKKSPR